MSVSNRSKLPKVYDYAESSVKKDIHIFWDLYLDAVDHVKDDIYSLAHDVAQNRVTNDDFNFWQTLFGLSAFTDEVELKEKILPVYSEYLEWRGTRKGLETLLSLLIQKHRFSIRENYLPTEVFHLGESRLNSSSRSYSESARRNSVVIEIDARRSQFSDSKMDYLRRVLRRELPIGCGFYFSFNDSKNLEGSVDGSEFLSFGEEL